MLHVSQMDRFDIYKCVMGTRIPYMYIRDHTPWLLFISLRSHYSRVVTN